MTPSPMSLAQASHLELSIYAAAFVRCFYESNLDKSDEERARLAAEEAEVVVSLYQRAASDRP